MPRFESVGGAHLSPKVKVVLWSLVAGLTTVFFVNATSAPITKTFSVDSNYADLSNAIIPSLHEEVDSRLGQNCFGAGVRKGPGPYRCGEYPIGKIKDASTKQILVVALKKDSPLVKFDNGEITLKDSFNFDVSIHRKQKSSWAQTDLLDNKNKNEIVADSELFKTVTLRHTPMGSYLMSLACTYLPGTQVAAQGSDFNTSIIYNWKIWFVSGQERASTFTKLSTAKLTVDNIKVCAVLKTTLVKGKPVVKVVDVSYPVANNFKVTNPLGYGTRVELHTLGIRLLNGFLKFFGVMDIEKLITEELEKKMNEQINGQIRTSVSEFKNGKLFKTMLESMAQQNLTADIVSSYKSAIAKQFDSTTIKYRESGEDLCVEAAEAFVGSRLFIHASRFTQFCKRIFANVEILPFEKNNQFKNSGCYSHPFSPVSYSAKVKDGWWKKSCGLTTKIKITLDEDFAGVAQCLENVRALEKSTLSVRISSLKKCSVNVMSAYLDLPEHVVRIIQTQGLSRLSEIQDVARRYKVPESIISNLGLYIK